MANNVSDQFFEPSTDTNANFANSVSGQTNSFFLPKVYSKQPKIWTEREITAMSLDQFDKYEDEIKQAMMEGRVVK